MIKVAEKENTDLKELFFVIAVVKVVVKVSSFA